ncbi:MAG: YeiH family protein [Dethiobacteria bacterium]
MSHLSSMVEAGRVAQKKVQERKPDWGQLFKKEDWWAVWLGFAIIIIAAIGRLSGPVLPLKWGGEGGISVLSALPAVGGLLLTAAFCAALFAVSTYFTSSGKETLKFVVAFPLVFLIAFLAELLGNYAPLRHYGFNNVVWALVLGLLISNTIKTPQAVRGAVRTELYIKTGLVLLGASILFNRILSLGVLGLGVAWIVTPIVIIFMYWFSQRVLKMNEHKGLAITIASAASVCGVSAAIATGTAARAKKEEISLAISISLIFTVLMMVGLPAIVKVTGMDMIVGGAWLGGTIDSTGAVVAAGAMLGPTAMEVASIIKMIQNILIGVVAFAVAVFWSVVYEKKTIKEAKVSPVEIWTRMPKFIIGFVIASIVFSFLLPADIVNDSLEIIDGYRSFFFTLAFVSIGLESNFGNLAELIKGGKPLLLYITGQLFNILLTLLAAYIFFSGRFFNLPF